MIFFIFSNLHAQKGQSHLEYHQDIKRAEELISHEKYKDAFIVYEQVFESYDFIFLRDYKIATQLALFLGDKRKAFNYLKLGIAGGWELKNIKKIEFLKPLQHDLQWQNIEYDYDSSRTVFNNNLNQALRIEAQQMFKIDQKMALRALFKIGQKAKIKYAETKFGPHSEIQIDRLNLIIKKYGFPSERLIGNDYWMATILVHHNSISVEYNNKDTLYAELKPQLIEAVKLGQMSPYEYALIENWRIAAGSNHKVSSYGFLGPTLNQTTLIEANQMRNILGLRSIETRNLLIDIQNKTGMDFYLPGKPWQSGKIIVANNNVKH